MLSFKDYEKEDGSIDWDRLRKAEIEQGYRCYTCKQSILFGGKGYQEECHQCKDLKSGRDVSHSKMIRCPSCEHTEFVDWESEFCYEAGEHEVYCSSCDKVYVVTTHVEYSYTSSPLEDL